MNKMMTAKTETTASSFSPKRVSEWMIVRDSQNVMAVTSKPIHAPLAIPLRVEAYSTPRKPAINAARMMIASSPSRATIVNAVNPMVAGETATFKSSVHCASDASARS